MGDGKRIDVWADPWLKKLPEGKDTQPDGVAPTNLKVCCLIDSERREWKMESVREIFTVEDAHIISTFISIMSICQIDSFGENLNQASLLSKLVILWQGKFKAKIS